MTAGDIHGETGLDCPVFEPLTRTLEAEHAVTYIVRTLMESEAPITMVGLDVTRKALCYPKIVDRMGKVGNKVSKLFVDLMGHFCKS